MSTAPTVTAALHRAAVYRVLAMAFAYPTPARLAAVADHARQAAGEAPATLRDALHRLADAARDADAIALAGEHVVLFQREVRCPPYEGAYGPAQMGGKAALLADVAGFYRAFGLEPAAGQPEVEDHIAVELEFMSVLAIKEAWALAEDHGEGLAVTHDAQRSFLGDHLARWGGVFAARLAATTAPGLYPAAAALLETWLGDDCARLDVAAVPLAGTNEAEAAPVTCPMAPATETEA